MPGITEPESNDGGEAADEPIWDLHGLDLADDEMTGRDGLIPFTETDDWPGHFGAARLGIP